MHEVRAPQRDNSLRGPSNLRHIPPLHNYVLLGIATAHTPATVRKYGQSIERKTDHEALEASKYPQEPSSDTWTPQYFNGR